MRLRHKIEDSDWYLGVSLICYALNAPTCGLVALSVAGLIIVMSILEDSK